MSVKIDKGRLGMGLEMTPMIDIVFLLMIFFLVASKLDEDDRSLDVILPQASAAKPLGRCRSRNSPPCSCSRPPTTPNGRR
jgi:biopolymer transport protein ExbD